jgi:hypothetical protein
MARVYGQQRHHDSHAGDGGQQREEQGAEDSIFHSRTDLARSISPDPHSGFACAIAIGAVYNIHISIATAYIQSLLRVYQSDI